MTEPYWYLSCPHGCVLPEMDEIWFWVADELRGDEG